MKEEIPVFSGSLVCDAQATLGEGAIWHPVHQRLNWLDIDRGLLFEFDPGSRQNESWQLPAKVGTVVPAAHGGFLVALQTGIHHFNPANGQCRLLVNPITDPSIRFNDGKCDPSGRFWVGTLHMGGQKNKAKLYRYDPDGTLSVMLEPVSNSNGIVWTSDARTLYYVDTPTSTIQAFDFDREHGSITNQRVAIRIPPEQGMPDGMTIDANDHLWVALWGGGCVHCYDPLSGKLLYKVTVPAPHTTSCAFGGPDLNTLYITSARAELPSDQLAAYPQSGGLFAVQLPVAGVPAHCFA